MAVFEAAVLLEPAEENIPLKLASSLFTLTYSLVFIPMAAAWHRVVLTPEEKSSHRLRLGYREWRYLKSFMILFLCWSLVMILVGGIIGSLILELKGTTGAPGVPENAAIDFLAVILVWVPYGVLILVFARILLRLPAAATGI